MASKAEGTKILNNCERCKYFHTEVREGGGLLEICEVTGGRVIGSDEGFDNCPFMEVKMNKKNKECIDDLNYIRKALTKGSLYQHDAIILLIDTIARYFEKGNEEDVMKVGN